MGRTLYDRLFLQTSYIDTPQALEEATKQWMVDGTRHLAGCYLPQMISYFKSDSIISSKEFRELDNAAQRALQAEPIPSYEILSVGDSFVSHSIIVLTYVIIALQLLFSERHDSLDNVHILMSRGLSPLFRS